MNILPCEINATGAALLGAIIGGIIGVIGTIITTWASFRTQKQSFHRSVGQQKINDVKSAYEFILHIIYLIRMEGFVNNNRSLHSEMLGKLAIFGSEEIKTRHMPTLAKGIPDDSELESIITLMQQHISRLEAQLI